MFSSAYTHAQLYPIQAIQAADVFPIDEPALSSQQDPNPKIAKTVARMGQIADAHS